MSEERKNTLPVTELDAEQTEARLRNLGDEINRITEKENPTARDEEYLEELAAELDEVEAHKKKLYRQALRARVDVNTRQPLKVTRGDNPAPKSADLDDDPFTEPVEDRASTFTNPWDLSEVRGWGKSPSQLGSEYRARALSAIEKMHGTNDKRRQAMTNIIEEWDNMRGDIAKQALITSHPDYMRAFNKASRGQESSMNDRERAAVERAMSLTDNAGGYLIPFQLDPAVIITSDGTLNETRRVSRNVIATGDVWNGVSSAAVSWSWDAEAAQASDDATTFAQPSISIHKAVGFVPISIEALQDEANVAAEVGRLLAFGKDTLESSAFATGSGSGQPYGVITALNTIAGSLVSATTNNSFGLPDVYKLDEQLPARYRKAATWAAHRTIYNDIRQFDTSGGAALWERLGADVPPLLLGRPAIENEGMDSSIGTVNDYVLLFGDFDNYVIADRVGTTVEFIPHLFSTNAGRPTGQRGWFAYYRVGADVVNNGAFRLLQV